MNINLTVLDAYQTASNAMADAAAPALLHLPVGGAFARRGAGRAGGRLPACLQRRGRFRGAGGPGRPSRHRGGLEGGRAALAAAVKAVHPSRSVQEGRSP